MDFMLEGKVAMVTGGSRGIGRAVALAFAAEGADVAITGAQDQEALDNVKAEIEALERRAIASIADVSHRAEIDNFIAAVADRWGRTDILVNNAGVIRMTPLEDISEEQWDRTIAVHLKGTFNCTQAVIPIMKRGSGGKIINVAAPSALRGSSGVSDYAAAKGGIIAFTQSLAGAYSKDGIRANAVCPGLVLTDRVRARAEGAFDNVRGDSDAYDTFKQYPFGVGEPEDIANIVLFLASDESRMVNGATIPAEGGISAY